MKIFSWVHRKLNQKDGLINRNVKKNEVIISNENTQVPLQDDSMAHLLGGWKGGILTIGTFGFDPLITDQLISGLNDNVEDEKCEITVSTDDHEELIYANNEHHELIISHDAEAPPIARRSDDDESNKQKERITLADLFSADFSDEEKIPLPDLCVTNNKKPSKLPQVKNGVSFTKKIIPRVREDFRLILKLQQLMTRALRRKVHPDTESKNHKNSGVIAAATMLDRSSITSQSISLQEILETTA
ncbi:hypothetical protein HAX54_040068 [Datura stramonium]|uniref:Uncharacterized protein n=1 Tax=Datura stramonium TaxID=4076 RepID=A0ABS8VRM0_DATST|nr:hypothetical protein [Datura stramonium]